MLRFRDVPEEPQGGRVRGSGFVGDLKGSRVLPDLPTAILARMRGFVNGSYPSPLRGMAAELGYHPLQLASAEELASIRNEIDSLMGKD